jgi:hypothetical protein
MGGPGLGVGFGPGDTDPGRGGAFAYEHSRPSSSIRLSTVIWCGAYDFPTRQLTPITGLVSFYNERVDIVVDGEFLPRPRTHFFN